MKKQETSGSFVSRFSVRGKIRVVLCKMLDEGDFRVLAKESCHFEPEVLGDRIGFVKER